MMATELEPKQPRVVDERPRCWRCERVLIESAARPWYAICARCKAPNRSQT